MKMIVPMKNVKTDQDIRKYEFDIIKDMMKMDKKSK